MGGGARGGASVLASRVFACSEQTQDGSRGRSPHHTRRGMIRLLISTSTFPLRTDDALPRFVYDLANALSPTCDVGVLAPDAPGALRDEQMGEVHVNRFTYFRPRGWQALAYGHGMRDNMRASPLAKLQVFPYLAAQVHATRAIVKRRNIQVVNSHWMIPQGWSTALACTRSRPFRHVLSVHAGDVYMLDKLPFGRPLARFIVRKTHRIFSDGSHVRDHLDALLGFESNAVVQPMGVHNDLFRQPQAPPPSASRFPEGFLLFFGRFAEKKGIRYLLQALPKIRRQRSGIGLVLIGNGAEEHALRKEAARLGIEEAVDFVGRKTHEEILPYLHGCRAVVVPSIIDSRGETDGMPTVVIEAMAAGARVVACAVNGIPDVVRDGENGWLCRPKDPDDLAEKILIALDDPPHSRIVDGALETAAALDWTNVAARYYDAFEQLLDAPAPGVSGSRRDPPRP